MTSVQWIGLLKTAVIPCGVTLAVLLALGRPWRRTREGALEGSARWVIPLAVALGFFTGSVAIVWWGALRDGPAIRRALWPADPTQRLAQYGLMALAGAGVVGLLAGRRARGWAIGRGLLRVAVVAGLATLLLLPRMRYAWTPIESGVAIAGLGAVGAIWWASIGAAAARGRGSAALWTLAVAAAGSAGTLFPTGSAKLSQQSVMLAGVLATCALASLARPDLAKGAGVGGVPAVLLAMLWGAGFAYAGAPVPPACVVLMALAPVAVLAPLALAVGRRPRWVGGLAAIGAAGVLMGVSGALAFAARGESAPGEAVPSAGDWGSMMTAPASPPGE